MELSFKIRPIIKQVKKENKTTSSKLLTLGTICLKDNGEYVVIVKDGVDFDAKETEYPITEESYNIYGKTVLYTKKPNEKGVYTVVIRSKNESYQVRKSFSYNPFKNKSKVKGNFVSKLGIKMFNIIDIIYPDSYNL